MHSSTLFDRPGRKKSVDVTLDHKSNCMASGTVLMGADMLIQGWYWVIGDSVDHH